MDYLKNNINTMNNSLRQEAIRTYLSKINFKIGGGKDDKNKRGKQILWKYTSVKKH